MNDKITNIESDYDVLEWNREKIAPRIKGIEFFILVNFHIFRKPKTYN